MAAEANTYVLGSSDDDFELVRVASLRRYRVNVQGGETLEITAHLHDVAAATGVLTFLTVDPTGRHCPRIFNSQMWIDVEEVTTPEQRNSYADVRQQVVANRALHVVAAGGKQRMM